MPSLGRDHDTAHGEFDSISVSLSVCLFVDMANPQKASVILSSRRRLDHPAPLAPTASSLTDSQTERPSSSSIKSGQLDSESTHTQFSPSFTLKFPPLALPRPVGKVSYPGFPPTASASRPDQSFPFAPCRTGLRAPPEVI